MKNSTIQCPKCKHEFQANEALNHQLQHLLTKEREELQQEFDKKDNLLRKHQAKIKQEKMELETTVNKMLAEREKEMRVQLKEKVKGEYAHEISELQKEVEEKQQMVNKAKDKELELARLQRKFAEQEKAYELKMERQLLEERIKLEGLISDREQQKHEMKFAEKDKQLNDLKKQLDEMKRKAEQGSMQLQGEVQELAIEECLRELFPIDEISEVAKGQRGGDTVQEVMDKTGRSCGKILYESKRTKNFNSTWIDKLKQDQQRENAQVAVLVTEEMPEGMGAFGWIDSICICKFSTLPIVASLMRDKIIELFCLKEVNTNRADKMALLYNYLTGTEFRIHIEEIIQGFESMKDGIEKEKRAFERIWKEREKQLMRVIQNTSQMYGSLKGIAGNALPVVEVLELPE